MNEAKFLELQYQTLRKEIEQANDRSFKLMLGGATGVPTVLFVAKTKGIEIITSGLPLLGLIIAFLFFAQNLTIKRCGRYIRKNIEPHLEETVGWETWLADDIKNRSYDRTIICSFYLLSAFYYIISVLLAKAALKVILFNRPILANNIILSYIIIGIVATFYIRKKTPICTKDI